VVRHGTWHAMIPYHGYETPATLGHTTYPAHHPQETAEPVPKYTR
jgi:hypothetical protein